jgi:hypothetical protein
VRRAGIRDTTSLGPHAHAHSHRFVQDRDPPLCRWKRCANESRSRMRETMICPRMRVGCWMNRVRLQCTDDLLVLTVRRARAGRAHRRVQESRHPVSPAERGSGPCGHCAFCRAVSPSTCTCSPTAAERRSGTCSISSASRTPTLSRLSIYSVPPLGHFLCPRRSQFCISSYTPLLLSAFSRPASRASTPCAPSADTISPRGSRRAIVHWLLRRL